MTDNRGSSEVPLTPVRDKPFAYTVIAWFPIFAIIFLQLTPEYWWCQPIEPAGKELSCGDGAAHLDVKMLRDILLIASATTLGVALVQASKRRLSICGIAGVAVSSVLAAVLIAGLILYASDHGP